MEPYSRFQSELHSAKGRVNQLQQEAESQRLVRGSQGETAFWRKRLATGLHGLADRLEPAGYHNPKGNLL